jgi:hypothetical protein
VARASLALSPNRRVSQREGVRVPFGFQAGFFCPVRVARGLGLWLDLDGKELSSLAVPPNQRS